MNRQFDGHEAYKVYDRNPLDLVGIALKFSTILKLTEKSAIVQFQDAIRGEFTEFSREKGMLVQINPDGLSQVEQDQYRFFNKSDTCSITLTKEQLAFETHDHHDRHSSIKRFNLALIALREVCNDLISPERFGVRYINSIDKEKISSDLKKSVGWSDLIEEKFLSIPGRQAGEDDTRYYCEVNSAMDNGRLITRYGLLPAQPSPRPDPTKVVFRFDCDRFTETDIELNNLEKLSLNFSSDINSAFTEVSGAKLIEWMNAEEPEELMQ